MRKTRAFVWTVTAIETPLGVATGYLIGVGDWGFILGIVALMLLDYISSRVWLNEIEENGRHGPKVDNAQNQKDGPLV